MKSKPQQQSQNDEVFEGVDAALRRAAKRAREVAIRTGTPLVIYRNGKIEKLKMARGGKSKSV
jgi:hypothetical protein